jgi:hypothetical protein
LLSNGFERERFTEFFFDGDFRCFVKTLIIGPVSRQGRQFRESTDNPAAVGSEPSRRLKGRRLPFDIFDLDV